MSAVEIERVNAESEQQTASRPIEVLRAVVARLSDAERMCATSNPEVRS